MTVRRLWSRILEVAAGGQIAELLIPIAWNEVRPLFMRRQPQVFDPIDYLKQRSFDGQGHEMLRILDAVLRQPFAFLRNGGSQTYVWPQFPVVPERAPLPSQQLAPWRCVRFADLGQRTATGGLPIHRITIGADGTWHSFWPDV